MQNKILPSPFIPSDKGNFDEKYCKGVDYIGEDTKIRYQEIFSEENYDECFKDFYYNIDEDKKRKNEMIFLSNNKNEKKEDIRNKKSINVNLDNTFDNKISSKSKNKNNKIIKNTENKKSNFILINFNINNITNNNIERKKIDNFYFNQNRKNDIKTIKSERLKNIINQLNNRIHKTIKSDISLLSLNTTKNIKNKSSLNDSKSKNKKNKDMQHHFKYNNSLLQQSSKNNLSKISLLKKKSLKKNEINKKIHLTMIKNEPNRNKILSLSFREKNNLNNYTKLSKGTKNQKLITLNESLRPSSHSRIINKIKYRIGDNSFKNSSSMGNIKSNKIIFNKKIIKDNNIYSKQNNKNFLLNNIPNCHNIKNSLLKYNENIRTLQNKSELINDNSIISHNNNFIKQRINQRRQYSFKKN